MSAELGRSADADFTVKLLASAVRFLIDGNEQEAARLLLVCSIKAEVSECTCGFTSHDVWDITLRGPRASYDALSDSKHHAAKAMQRAFAALLPPGDHLWAGEVSVRAELVDVDANWRAEVAELLRGAAVSNQLADSAVPQVRVWQNLRFRSESERKVAVALDKTGVLFLPLCMARLSTPQGRANKEPDFLVCHRGKWGILEVDGEPFHPPSRKVHEDERDRLFKSHGIRVVEHYDSQVCYETPDKVVQEFLRLLAES